MNFTAVVPARSGSKRVPGKNVRMLADKPLLAWTLEACAGADQIDTVILSTDSEDYWSLAKKHIASEKLELDFRTPDEAGDSIKIFDYLKGKKDKLFGTRNGAFVLALPTVPLRTSAHIEEALALFQSSGRPVFSATSYGFPISFAFHVAGEGEWATVFDDNPMLTGNTRSQDQKAAYHPNGAIYVRAIEDLANPKLASLYESAIPLLMDPNSSIDIDNEVDFVVASALLERR
jgi:CMP-N-acetylneuraminic acid synthetase